MRAFWHLEFAAADPAIGVTAVRFCAARAPLVGKSVPSVLAST